MTARPNFVFFITDQQRADWLGCAGHPVVRTPNIDAIAAQGTRFTDFHGAIPVCMPNRASLLTGRMPSVHGLRYNGCQLPQNANTFVDVLGAGGYDTASIGKSHVEHFSDVPPVHQVSETARSHEEAWKPSEQHSAEEPSNFKSDERYAIRTPYFGYQHVDVVSRHGDRCGGHYEQWFRDNCEDWQALWDPENELPHNYTCPQARRTPVPEEMYPTTYVADRAIEYLNDPARDEAPFFTFVSFPDPHHPFNPPGKYWDMYSPEDFEVDLPYSAHENPTPPMKWLQEHYKNGSGQSYSPQTVTRVDDQSLREAMALTAGMITMIDDQIGRVVQTLKDRGLFENTVICFNSDHGDHLGDFGMLLKGPMPFASLTRVPMIWSDPSDRNGSQTAALASTIDIGPSILERAGLAPYDGIQGRSFLPSLGDASEHRKDLLIECNDAGARCGLSGPARVRTLRDRNWRLSVYGGEDWGELYDLAADPNETRNLWDDADSRGVRDDMILRLVHHLTAQMDESPKSKRQA